MTVSLPGSPSPRVAYASQLGCALDSDLSTGGGTDDTALLNAFLATASATHPIKLIIDGVALITGLVLSPSGYTTIEGLGGGSGFFVASGAKMSCIYNAYPPTSPSAPPDRLSSNVVFRDFLLNGNGPGGNTYPLNYGISLVGTQNILLDNIVFVNPGKFCTRFDNCSDITVTRCRFITDLNLQDGVHICGPGERILVHGCYFSTGDDAVAINCPEGYGGDITDVVVSDCIFDNAWTVARVYTSDQPVPGVWYARRIVFSRCIGSIRTFGFHFGVEFSHSRQAVNQVQDITVTDCDLTCLDNFVAISHPFGTISVIDCIYRSPTERKAMVSVGWQGADLYLSNCNIVRTTEGHAAACFLEVDPPFLGIDRITLHQLRLTDEQGSQYERSAAMVNIYGSVGRLRIGDLDTRGFQGFADPVNGLDHVQIVTGSGVLSTRMAIPDEKIDDGVLYVSASTGKLSIKLAGKVQPLA